MSTDDSIGSEHAPEGNSPPALRVRRTFRLFGFSLIVLLAASSAARADAILFDGSHHEMAGNADWIADADTFDLVLQAFPCTEIGRASCREGV